MKLDDESTTVDLTKMFAIIYPGEKLQYSNFCLSDVRGFQGTDQDTYSKTGNQHVIHPKKKHIGLCIHILVARPLIRTGRPTANT